MPHRNMRSGMEDLGEGKGSSEVHGMMPFGLYQRAEPAQIPHLLPEMELTQGPEQSLVSKHEASLSLGRCSEVSVDVPMKSKSQSFLLSTDSYFCLFRKSCSSVGQQALHFHSPSIPFHPGIFTSELNRFLNFFMKLLIFSTASPFYLTPPVHSDLSFSVALGSELCI